MSEQKRYPSLHGKTAYRVAVRLFESAFAALEHLPEADQHLLLIEIGKRVLGRMPQPPLETAKPIQIVGVEIKLQSSEDAISGRNRTTGS
jgi:hypothetical protein